MNCPNCDKLIEEHDDYRLDRCAWDLSRPNEAGKPMYVSCSGRGPSWSWDEECEWSPSRNIEDAWPLLEEMRGAGWWLWDYKGQVWDIMRPNKPGYGNVAVGESEDLPLLVSRAYLTFKALSTQENQII